MNFHKDVLLRTNIKLAELSEDGEASPWLRGLGGGVLGAAALGGLGALGSRYGKLADRAWKPLAAAGGLGGATIGAMSAQDPELAAETMRGAANNLPLLLSMLSQEPEEAPTTVRCQYCGTQNDVMDSNCQACGAPL